MAISAALVTVTSTPTLLTVGRDRDGNPGRSMAVSNPGPVPLLIGGPDVGEETGFLLAAESDVTIDLRTGDALYGVSGGDDQAVYVLQVGV